MKTIFAALVLTFFLGIFSQTNAQRTTVDDTETRTVVLKVNKQKPAAQNNIKIQFLGVIEDSRCPTDVQCISAGNARVQIKMTSRKSSEVFEINTFMGARGASFEGYAITLISLTPSPKTNIRISRNGYTAQFEIRRLQR
jgi:hypothetical protein